eukprot:3915517-Karenia_brevis.AAC.1
MDLIVSQPRPDRTVASPLPLILAAFQFANCRRTGSLASTRVLPPSSTAQPLWNWWGPEGY